MIITNEHCLEQRTIGDTIDQYFQSITHYINQPAQNRGYQSPFTNFNVFDSYYWHSAELTPTTELFKCSLKKAEEAVLATWVERKYSKDEVLEMYFNTTYFGAGAYGIRDAARKYFGKEPAQLTLGESAMLAAMPYAPSALNPYENPSGCAKRVRLVLKEMLKYGYIGNTEYDAALSKGVTLKNGRVLRLE